MPFFAPQVYLSPEAQFFSLLSELDHPSAKTCGDRQQCSSRQQQPGRVSTFAPRFDVAETANAYELYGELAGIEEKDISIEFSDAQTLVIKGRNERLTPSTTPAAITPAITEKENVVSAEKDTSDTASEKSLNATVEDDYDAADAPLATRESTTDATVEADVAPAKKAEPVAQEPKPKFWAAERKVGQFSRSFSFAQRIDQDGVSAGLKNGILHVVVPKSQKSKKVVIGVN